MTSAWVWASDPGEGGQTLPVIVQVSDIAAWLGVPESQIDVAQCEMAIAGVEAQLPRLYDVPADWYTDPNVYDFKLGVIMAVAKLRRRADSPAGQIGFDGAVSLVFYDPDVTAMFAAFEKREGRFG